jgi:hypothetical protein
VPVPVWLPAFDISPFTVTVPDGVNVALEPIVRVLTTETEPDAVTVAEAAIVKPRKASVPEFAIEEPLFIVMVPEDGLKFALALTVKAPPIEKLLDVVTVAELAMVMPLTVSVPEFVIEAPLLKVIVPPEGLRVTPESTVRAAFTV